MWAILKSMYIGPSPNNLIISKDKNQSPINQSPILSRKKTEEFKEMDSIKTELINFQQNFNTRGKSDRRLGGITNVYVFM